MVFRVNGRNAVGIGIVKQATANPLDVSKGLNEALPTVRASLPDGMEIDVVYDSSLFIDRSIAAVFESIGEATALVVIVIFVFLRNFRATLIPIVTIPVSLVATFAIMLAMGFSINTLTLLAMVLAVGLVVDDAIVVLENISRHVENGMHPVTAAIKGSREIGFAVVAMTITLAAVYAPLGFQTGRTGRLFGEFALTLAGAVIVSGFVALTLSPMMSSLLLKHEPRHGFLYNLFERGFSALNNGYKSLLTAVLTVRPLVLIVVVAVGGAGWLLFSTLRSELSPVEDRGVVLGIAIAPEGSTIGYTDGYARRMEGIYGQTKDVARYGVVTGFPVVNQIISFIVLEDWSARTRSQMAVAQELQPKMFLGLPGVLSFPLNPPSLGQSFGAKPVEFVVQTSGSYDELSQMVEALLVEARKFPGFLNLDSDLKLNKPQLKIAVDREKVSDLGLRVDQVGRTLETLLGGRQVTRFKFNGKQYDVIVKTGEENRRNPDDMNVINVRGNGGAMVPLSNIVDITEAVAPKELNHFNKLRSATVSATLAPGVALADGLAYLDAAARRTLPASATVDYAGQSREFRVSSAGILVTFLLALGFIYLVLAAQFESFVDPLIIMLSVPLAMVGALLALTLTGSTLNVYSQIGLITLIGLITKHGILIVEFANQMRENGMSKVEAVVEAAALRLRPILMTTFAMVLGAVPLALATGAESRSQIGWVIVGGMTFGTLLTLFVVPTAYAIRGRREMKNAAREAALASAAE